jgi:tetratricopeptide (TPR) repeat protein
MVLAVIAFNTTAFPQAALPSTETQRANIRSAAERKESPEELGKLWLLLGNRYQDRFELEKAEDAYANAIHLLRDTSAQSQYAESLRGMGVVINTFGRFKEARKCLTKSLDIYMAVKDETNAANGHLSLGLELFAEHKYREAEDESTAALKGFERTEKHDAGDVSMAYLTRGRAICNQGRCRSALDDVSQAQAVIPSSLPENSIERISIWLVQGQIQMKAGLQAEGEESMKQALRLVQSRTDLPPAYLVALELVILRAQRASLKAAHRKEEAKYAEEQIRRIEAEAPAACNGCTVSVAGLASSGLR